jgi:hypothetical protein
MQGALPSLVPWEVSGSRPNGVKNGVKADVQ